MAYVWAYDGAATLSVTFPSTVGKNYDLSANDLTSTSIGPIAGTGGSLTLTITDAGGIATGDYFSAFLADDATGEGFACTSFRVGTTGESGIAAAWAYDGLKTFSVTFTGTAGISYRFYVFDVTNGGAFTDLVATGGSDTITVVTTANATGNHIKSWVFSTTGAPTSPLSRLFVGGTADSGTAGSPGGSAGQPAVPGPHALVIKIYDLQSNLLSDISTISLEKQLVLRHNLPRQCIVTVPAGHSLVTSTAADGFPVLESGDRKLLVWRGGLIVFHGRIFNVERTGDGTRNLATITAFDPLMELGTDADTAGRPVRDETGNFIDPSFNGDGAITGGDLIYQALTNSVQTGIESDPTPGEGPLPIYVAAANFDRTVGPGVDLSPIDSMDWPVMIGAFIAQIVDTGVCDVYARPIDPSEGKDPYQMIELKGVNRYGSNVSNTVHFDYWTGSKNVRAARHVQDFTTICNKLYDYLGPRIDQQHWKGNITPTAPGVTVSPFASRDRYGTFMTIRIFDSVGTENSSRPLYTALWNAEAYLRLGPRSLLYMQPSQDSAALYDPFTQYGLGDLVGVNTGGDFGIALAATQRIYGYSVTWNRENYEQVSELITSADAE